MTVKKSWYSDLPDSREWKPKEDAKITLENAFFKRCRQVEKSILLRQLAEKQWVINNYDAGLGIEDIIRDELSKICPRRYSVRSGVIDDRKGRTAGDFDIVIINDQWFPSLKLGASEASRRYHYPIESVFAVIEVKQTLTYQTFDEAMEKLVKCHRLYRPNSEADKINENRSLHEYELIDENEYKNTKTNPLFSAIISPRLGKNVDIYGLGYRMYEISKLLKRSELVSCICVLGEGSVTWGSKNPEIDGYQRANFLHDNNMKLTPIMEMIPGNPEGQNLCALYTMLETLLQQLHLTILDPNNIYPYYGFDRQPVFQPIDQNISLDPD